MPKLRQRNFLIGCLALSVLAFIAITALGYDFLFLPIIIVGGFYFVIAKVFDIISGLDVVGAHMWTDIRKRPSKEQKLQILAASIAAIIVAVIFFIP